MDTINNQMSNEAYFKKAISTALRIGFVGLLVIMSYLILKPFLVLVMWSTIIAVGIYPIFKKFAGFLGNREKLASTLMTIFALTVLIVPSYYLMESTVDSVQHIAVQLDEGTFKVPPPSKNVSEWPVIGKPIYETWNLASVNLEAAIRAFEPQIKELATNLLSTVAGLGATILLSLIAILISGVFLVKSDSLEIGLRKSFKILIGEQGEGFTTLASATIRSVVQGVLGVALIQSVVSGIIMLIFTIPGAGLWALIVLFMAIIQLPPILILGPVAIYAFNILDTTSAVIFLILSIIVSGADTFLKPILMGRGVDVPTLVVLLGAIGGMMLAGIIGLFVGAVILALTFKIYQALIEEESLPVGNQAEGENI